VKELFKLIYISRSYCKVLAALFLWWLTSTTVLGNVLVPGSLFSED